MSKKKFKGQLGDIDLRLLRIYKIVVECGGFSAAEVELNISRAAISIAMSDLESRLGFRLCQRGRSGFALSEEGEHIYNYTLQLLSSLEDFRTQVNTLHTHLKGELNIGITDNLVTMPQMRITNALSALKKQGPDVTVNIHMSPPNEIEIGVLDGRLHIGIVPDLRPLAGLTYLPLYQEESQLYCSNGHPLFSTQEIDYSDLNTWDAVVPAYAQTPEIKALHQQLNATATATDREGIAFLILTGCYIGYLPVHLAEHWIQAGRMRPLLPEKNNYSTLFSVITRKGARSNLVQQTYLDCLATDAPRPL
ncbi:LysR family transcriptional regulator [Neptunomonas antarctica]|uniref:DNA-binding transcriptional regulator, LysR family n=1 Tax=Neptunomonas antarctica TaxID=619304 RepID=A0A1N7JB03_9GAMM|nr:LysR family transcriptional regulator [Neptunomonas antarctica]SIS46446.1 DNA-binding transcriptional regulator, LysR family [Neptunomonas antarctica]